MKWKQRFQHDIADTSNENVRDELNKYSSRFSWNVKEKVNK